MHALAIGPRAARSTRQSMLRKVQIEHGDHFYSATIRNISRTGAMIEGLWNVPKNTIFRIRLSSDQTITATARWSQEDRLGVEFSAPLARDEGATAAAEVRLSANPVDVPNEVRRKAG